MKKGVYIGFLVVGIICLLAFSSYADNHTNKTDWQWKSSTAVAESPGIVHTIWEAARPPYGPYDKIALHRFVYEGPNGKLNPSRQGDVSPARHLGHGLERDRLAGL